MIDRGKRNVLGVAVSVIDYEAAVATIMHAAESLGPMRVSAAAVHGVVTAVKNEPYRWRLNHFDIVTPDGQPVRWALRWLHGERLADRVYGPRLMSELLHAAAERSIPVFLYGSTTDVLDHLAVRIAADHPMLRIAGREPSKFRAAHSGELEDIARRIRASGARLVFVGTGCPRQERLTWEIAPLVGMPVVAVGAAFDYLAGTLRVPPAWMQRWGLEWLWRLAADPRRLWRRYVVLNPQYLVLVAAQRLGVWSPPSTQDGDLPTESVPV